jgi:hypothetical protein
MVSEGYRLSYHQTRDALAHRLAERAAGRIQLKTGRISAGDLGGLGEFVRRNPKFRPLVVCDEDARPVAERAGFESTLWSEFLLHGPPGVAADS